MSNPPAKRPARVLLVRPAGESHPDGRAPWDHDGIAQSLAGAMSQPRLEHDDALAGARPDTGAPGGRLELTQVDSIAAAVAALRTGQFDFVTLDARELLPFAQAIGPHRLDVVLENIGQGVCIVDSSGELVWGNGRLLAYPPDAIDAVRRAAAEMAHELAHLPAADGQRTLHRTLRAGAEHYFDVAVTPLRVRSGAGETVEHVVALVCDLTAKIRLQEKINAIDAAGRELLRLDADATARMDVGERLRYLEETLFRYCNELLNFNHFTVRILDPGNNKLETVLAGGISEEARSLDIFALAENNGISGFVAATGQSYICPDISSDPRYLPGLETARSSLTVPLRLENRVVGILNVESDRPNAFTNEDRQFAEIFGNYIAAALNILKLLAAERFTTTGQIAADVSSELSKPLNEIVSEATDLIEDHIGDDKLRARLRGIIETVARAKRIVQSVSSGGGVRGLSPERVAADPLLDGRRVLIAEDEEIIRETMSDVLSKAGAITLLAEDGERAIAMIRQQRFDLVLSDIKMPVRNGYDVFAAARAADPECPVLLITGFGYDPEHQIVRANREGLAGVLFKPFKVEKLLEEVRKALAGRRPR